MDVDPVQTSKKRPATEDISKDDLPAAKRAKFGELFPSVFSSTDAMDINTLKMQNKELVCKLTERKMEVQEMATKLFSSEQNLASQAASLTHIASLITLVAEESQTIIQVSPSSSMDTVPSNIPIDFYNLFAWDNEGKLDSDKLEAAKCSIKALMQKISQVYKAYQMEKQSISKMIQESNISDAFKSDQQQTLAENSALKNRLSLSLSNEQSLRKNVLELKEQVANTTKALNIQEKTQIELRLRLERLSRHVTRLEIEIEKLKAAQAEAVAAATAAAASISNQNGSDNNNSSSNAKNESAELIQQNQQLTNELEEAKRIAESRLNEINTLRSEKIELIRSSGSTLTSDQSSSLDRLNKSISFLDRVLKEDPASLASSSGTPSNSQPNGLGYHPSSSVAYNNQHESKPQFSRENSLNQLGDSMPIDSSILQESQRISHLEHQIQALQSESKAKGERIRNLLKSIEELNGAHQSAKTSLLDEFRKQSQTLQRQVDNVTTKLKNMEQDRDQAKHKLVSFQEAHKHAPVMDSSQLLHVQVLERQLKEIKDEFSKLQASHSQLKQKHAELEAECDHNTLLAKVSNLEDQNAVLKNTHTKLQQNSKLEHLQLAQLEAELEQTKKKLAAAEAQVREGKDQIQGLSQALDELSSGAENNLAAEECEKMALTVAEKDKKIDLLLKEKSNNPALHSINKKHSAMSSELSSSNRDTANQLAIALESERSSHKKVLDENSRLQKEIISMQTSFDHQQTINSHTSVVISILTKRISDLEAQVKQKEQEVKEALSKAEEEKGLRARLDEELQGSKRQLSNLKNSTLLTSSMGISPGDAADRIRKDLHLYQQMFNCALCERARKVDSVITTCGHVFCNICIDDKCLKPRNRKCPKCKKQFGAGDVGSLYF